MATSSFYHDNLFRCYPLRTTEDARAFSSERLAGVRIVCSYDAPFARFPSAFLTRWQVRGDGSHEITFLCRSGAVQLSSSVTVPAGAEPFTTHSSAAGPVTARVTVGRLPSSPELWTGTLPLEPVCVLWLKHRGLRCVRVGNINRNRLDAAFYPGISPDLASAYRTSWWRQPVEITNSPLLFEEGYNCLLETSLTANQIQFRPAAGQGDGEVAEFVPLGSAEVRNGVWTGEMPETSAPVRPDGLPWSTQVLYVFSGATGPEITRIPSETVGIRLDTDESGRPVVSVEVQSLSGSSC